MSDVPPEIRATANVVGNETPIGSFTKPGPYILLGRVDITVGPLRGHDTWNATVTASSGEIRYFDSSLEVSNDPVTVTNLAFRQLDNETKRQVAEILASSASARAPPSDGSRVVYVVGEVGTVEGPALSEHSQGSLGVLDLRVSHEEYARYEREVKLYQEHVARERIAAEISRVREATARSKSRPVRGR